MFEHYLPLTEDKISEIWENSIIIFDTNILLHLYRYDNDLSDKLFSILEDKNIKPRIWIPAKVYEEFLKNRAKVICEQWDIEQKIISTINREIDSIKSKVNKHFSHRYHPYIKEELINEHLDKSILEIENHIHKEKEIKYKLDISKDDFLIKIIKILEGKIGEVLSDPELDDIYNEGKKRYEKLIPPGYKDSDKDSPEKYSDLVIWKNIITKAKEGHDVIFIVDDKKEDWWRIEKGKTIGPQPLLLKEFHEETGKNILFYDSIRFYKYVDEFISKKKILGKSEDDKLKKVSVESFFSKKSFDQSFRHKPKIKRKTRNKYSKDEVLSWFKSNYKDPADGVPYISREGGYQYWNGGPYDPEEEILSYFEDIDEETLVEVLDEIHPYGFEWVKVDQY